jgi:hypothetical protein
MMCTAIASTIAMLIATMIRKNFPKAAHQAAHRFLKVPHFSKPIREAHTPGTGSMLARSVR